MILHRTTEELDQAAIEAMMALSAYTEAERDAITELLEKCCIGPTAASQGFALLSDIVKALNDAVKDGKKTVELKSDEGPLGICTAALVGAYINGMAAGIVLGRKEPR